DLWRRVRLPRMVSGLLGLGSGWDRVRRRRPEFGLDGAGAGGSVAVRVAQRRSAEERAGYGDGDWELARGFASRPERPCRADETPGAGRPPLRWRRRLVVRRKPRGVRARDAPRTERGCSSAGAL